MKTNAYELTFLVNDESEVKTIKDIVESVSGKVEKEEKWGKKTLAYPIEKATEAYFSSWVIEIEPNNILELKKKLNFNDKLIRYLLLKMDSKPDKKETSKKS
jgi:small subunit ribosomal protein S6